MSGMLRNKDSKRTKGRERRVGERGSDQECWQGEISQVSALPSSSLRFWRQKEINIQSINAKN
jgi:hypothetical protein